MILLEDLRDLFFFGLAFQFRRKESVTLRKEYFISIILKNLYDSKIISTLCFIERSIVAQSPSS